MSNHFSFDRFMTEWVFDGSGSEADQDAAVVSEVVHRAVDALLEVHASTGLDLTQFEGPLQLVTLVHPHVVIEGTGPTDVNTVTSPASHGETGRYWLDGDTSKPCNRDAWVVSPDYVKHFGLVPGHTR